MNKNDIIKNCGTSRKYTEVNIVSETQETCFYINFIAPYNYGVVVNVKDFKTQKRFNNIVKQIKENNQVKIDYLLSEKI